MRQITLPAVTSICLFSALFGAGSGSFACAQLGQSASQSDKQSDSPGATWDSVAPESIGYSSLRFDALTSLLKTEHTTAMMVVVHGKVLYQYGDVARVSTIASIRKSVLGMLYGSYVFSEKIDLGKTVKEVGLNDVQPFLPIEESATLEHLLAGRSGIYIVPEKPDPRSSDAYQLRRGSEVPGTHFSYNEWDFNAAGTAFEKLTGKNIYDALASDLAGPIGMQDFKRSLQVKADNHPFSVHAGYPMSLSTRDMARLGQLMLRKGSWNGKQLIPVDWVRFSTTLLTPFQDMNPTGFQEYTRPERWGFGLMWWVWDEPTFLDHNWTGPYQGAFSAMGSGGQYITVFPAADMVVVHKVDLDPYRGDVSTMQWDAILNMVLAAYCEGNCPNTQ